MAALKVKTFDELSDDFMRNVEELLEELQEIMKDYPETKDNVFKIGLGKVALKLKTNQENFLSYIESSHQSWPVINRGVVEILKNEEIIGSLFGELPDALREIAIKIFSAKKSNGEIIFDEEDQEVLMSFFTNMVKIAIKGVKVKRKEDQNFVKEIDLVEMCQMWNIPSQ